MNRQMAEMMIERLFARHPLSCRVVFVGDGDFRRAWRRRIVGTAPGPVGCNAGKRPARWSACRTPAPVCCSGCGCRRRRSASPRASASPRPALTVSAAVFNWRDGFTGFGVGFGLPAIGDNENLGDGKGERRHRSRTSFCARKSPPSTPLGGRFAHQGLVVAGPAAAIPS